MESTTASQKRTSRKRVFVTFPNKPFHGSHSRERCVDFFLWGSLKFNYPNFHSAVFSEATEPSSAPNEKPEITPMQYLGLLGDNPRLPEDKWTRIACPRAIRPNEVKRFIDNDQLHHGELVKKQKYLFDIRADRQLPLCTGHTTEMPWNNNHTGGFQR